MQGIKWPRCQSSAASVDVKSQPNTTSVVDQLEFHHIGGFLAVHRGTAKFSIYTNHSKEDDDAIKSKQSPSIRRKCIGFS